MDDPLEAEARSGSAPAGVDRSDLSERLDDDKLADDFPPDRPRAVEDYGTTPQEQRVREPIAERVERENPEQSAAGDVGNVGTVVQPDEGARRDDEESMVAREVGEVRPHDRPVGDVGTGDVTNHGTVLDRSDDTAAEEAAVHERGAP